MPTISNQFTLQAVKDGTDAAVRHIECSVPAVSVDSNNVQKQAAVFRLVETTGTASAPFTAYIRLTVLAGTEELYTQATGKVSELSYTLPATQYGTATALKVEAFTTEAMTEEACPSLTVNIVRENPVPFPRGEAWAAGNTYKNGEYLIYDNIVYMWRNPVSGNSALDPAEDIRQNPDTTSWQAYQEWPLLATQVMLARWAKLGSAIFDGDHMFSQHGQDASGQDTDQYTLFDPSKLGQASCPFTPNVVVDWLLGKLIGLDMDVRGGRVGSLLIDGNTLSADDDRSGIVIGTGKGAAYTGKRLQLGGEGAAAVNVEIRAVAGKDPATGLAIANYASGGKCLSLLSQGASLAVESYGGCRMVQRYGEAWDVAGVLWSARMNGALRQESWGNGLNVSSIENLGDAHYRFHHDLGHEDYYVHATAIVTNWQIAAVVDRTAQYFTVALFHKDQGWTDGSYFVTVVGRNRVRT